MPENEAACDESLGLLAEYDSAVLLAKEMATEFDRIQTEASRRRAELADAMRVTALLECHHHNEDHGCQQESRRTQLGAA